MERAITSTTEFVKWLRKRGHVQVRKSKYNSMDEFFELKDETLKAKCFEVSDDYANLVSQPPQLGFFTPCVDGKPIKEPDYHDYQTTPATIAGKAARDKLLDTYQQAKEQVLFPGWEVENDWHKVGMKATRIVLFCKKLDSQLTFENDGKGNVSSWIRIKNHHITSSVTHIEQLSRRIELIGNNNFWKKVGLNG